MTYWGSSNVAAQYVLRNTYASSTPLSVSLKSDTWLALCKSSLDLARQKRRMTDGMYK